MEQNRAAHAFATLGHPGRMAVFRLLMRFAPQGVRPTEIAEALGLKQNTLSHHLADLAASGLVHVTRVGRSLYYAVDLDTTEGLIGYLALDVGRARPDLLAPLLSAPKDTVQMDRTLPDTDFDVLFICSGNSARSIFAEALLRDLGKGKFQAFSAGHASQHRVEPLCAGYPAAQRPRHLWPAVQAPLGIPAARFHRHGFRLHRLRHRRGRGMPPWPGQPITGHWGLPDPVKATGTDAEKALVFAQTYAALRRRIMAFVELPFASLSRMSLQSRVDAIGSDAQAKA